MRFEAAVFDLDGTLLDTLDDLADSMNRVLARQGLPAHETPRYRYFVGDGLRKMVERVLPGDERSPETVERLMAAMRDEYGRHWADKTRPYVGIAEMLDGLTQRGIRMSVLSNKPDEFTKLCVERLLAGRRFEVVRGVVPGGPVKPDPAGAIAISREMGVPADRFFYLGDTATDMRTARAAGMYAVGALWGFRDHTELLESGASAVARQPADVLPLLE
jgi:phosphoglycolate phosphatase